MKKTAVFAALFSLGLSGAALSQAAPKVAGKVTKVDASAGKITIDHGPIPNLEMPAMTMVFKAGEDSMLKAVKAGDRVTFTADKINGQYTVTKIDKAK
jgi:Cu(I)/Ag(I) efflux system periplasmic protein CusF